MSEPEGPWSDQPPPERRLGLGELWRLAWPNIVVTVGILAVAAWQVWRMLQGDGNLGIDWGGLSALALLEGRWWTPFTSMFMHAGIAHLIFNLIALSQLGPIVAVRFGRDGRALVTYLAFYVLCGLIGDAVYLAIHPAGFVPMIGASGAIFGLWGASARLGPNGSLVPIFSRQVWKQTQGAIVSNLIIMAIVLLPALMSGQFGMGGIAWEAHLGGYLAGLLLVGLPVFRARPINL
ncbi:MAG: rhomboid family intrarane serine protease [Caulobacter sp.]|jgi:membrane associated rhomboid family serine protease|nr:rhomboid family intrarane serine protease [Caulobacter sp.]